MLLCNVYTFANPFKKLDKDTANKKYDKLCINLIQSHHIHTPEPFSHHLFAFSDRPVHFHSTQ